MRIIENNKAIIEIHKDFVVKKHKEAHRDKEEYELLKIIGDFFIPFSYNEWSYHFVEVMPEKTTESGGVVMKKIEGHPLANAIDEMSYFHAGLWLGQFHSLSFGNGKVKTFYDYTLSNIFIDSDKRIITALDPGNCALTEKNYYFDILKFFSSAIISHYKRKTLFNRNCIALFIKGYKMKLKTSFDAFSFDSSEKQIIADLRNSQRLSKESKIKMNLGVFLLKLNFRKLKQQFGKNDF